MFGEDFEIGDGELTASDRLLEQAQQNILQTSALSEKIDQLGEANVANLTEVASFFNDRMAELQTTLIIVVILSSISMIGLWWAVYLYFQSRDLIIFKERKKDGSGRNTAIQSTKER